MKNKRDIFIHKSAFVDPGAVIGKETSVWHFSHICAKARLGDNCKIGQNVYVADNVRIGNNVKIQNNVSVYEGVTLEDNVFCGPSCVFTNIINPRCLYPRNSKKFYKPIRVRNGASIGANATIVCGVTIGRNAFIGAGAVVTSDIPDHALVYGNPARPKGWMCECGEKIKFKSSKAKCRVCAKKYKISGGRVAGL